LKLLKEFSIRLDPMLEFLQNLEETFLSSKIYMKPSFNPKTYYRKSTKVHRLETNKLTLLQRGTIATRPHFIVVTGLSWAVATMAMLA
jgi:hypothetical protein